MFCMVSFRCLWQNISYKLNYRLKLSPFVGKFCNLEFRLSKRKTKMSDVDNNIFSIQNYSNNVKKRSYV